MKRLIILIVVVTMAACHDHDSREINATTGGDTTLNKADSLVNGPGTGFGNETTDSLGVSTLGSGTDTSGSLQKKP